MSAIESPALTLRVRRCVDCGQTKPWGEYYPRKKWEDGTMRVPESRCKACSLKRLNDYAATVPRRPRDQRWYQRVKADPERYAIRLEHNRARHRRNRGTRPENYRGIHRLDYQGSGRGQPVPDPQPFIDWLRTLGDDAEQIGAECGIDPAQVRKYLSGAMVPTERTVDRAVTFAEQTHRLNELLPLGDTDGIH